MSDEIDTKPCEACGKCYPRDGMRDRTQGVWEARRTCGRGICQDWARGNPPKAPVLVFEEAAVRLTPLDEWKGALLPSQLQQVREELMECQAYLEDRTWRSSVEEHERALLSILRRHGIWMVGQAIGA
jgi:hypothetical protein